MMIGITVGLSISTQDFSAFAFWPHSRDECKPNLVCFVPNDFVKYTVFFDGNPHAEKTYTHEGFYDDEYKIAVHELYTYLDPKFKTIVGGKVVNSSTSLIQVDLRSGYVVDGQYAILQPSPVSIDKWIKHSTSADYWKDKVSEDTYNFKNMERNVILIAYGSTKEIIDKDTGILLFRQASSYGIVATEKLVDTNVFTFNKPQVPNWIKNNAKWWSESSVSDNDFIQGMQYLIKEKIIQVPETQAGTSSSQQIPSWIKNNAKWWADGQISDDDFISGIQYLISNGIMKV